MAKAQDIENVSASIPGVPRYVIESRIDSGAINPENYGDEDND